MLTLADRVLTDGHARYLAAEVVSGAVTAETAREALMVAADSDRGVMTEMLIACLRWQGVPI